MSPSAPAVQQKPWTRKKTPLWPVAEIIQRLEPAYGPAQSPREYDAISELVYTILSQHTSDLNSVPAYYKLRESFPSWDAIAAAEPVRVMEAIRRGGLAQIKGPRVQQVLREVKARTGGYDLSFLATMPLAEAKAWLRALPGVGPKTVGCVLLFALGMPALPVDTHVYRVAQRLRMFGPGVTPDQSHDVLESKLAAEQVLPFHMYLINHGRRVCKAQRPLCAQCVLEERCPSSMLKVKRKTRKAAGTSRSRGSGR